MNREYQILIHIEIACPVLDTGIISEPACGRQAPYDHKK